MLSNSCRYGIRAVIYIASQPFEKGKTGIKQISKDLDLPAPFLAKILQQLARHKILTSLKGPHGGFSLMKDPREITLFDIILTIDGEELFTNCVMHNGSCRSVSHDKKPCPLHNDYARVRTDMMKLFKSRTIADIVKATSKSGRITI